MKKNLHFLFFILPNFLLSQVGIGTTNPDDSSILDLTSTQAGLLIPRMTTEQRDLIENPAQGLIIYNTLTNTIDVNTGSTASPLWSIVESSNSVKFSNSDIITNINTDAVTFVPIFGNENWNDDVSVFNKLSTRELEVLKAGRYRIILNLSVSSDKKEPETSPELQLYINGVARGSFASTGYISKTKDHEYSSLHLLEIFNLNAGDILSVGSKRNGKKAGIFMRSEDTSNIYVEKLR